MNFRNFLSVSSALNTYWILGRHKINSTEGVKYTVRHTELHPRFRNASFFDDFDMALATVKGEIQFSRNVQPICLPSVNDHENYVGKLLIVAGWWD